MSAANTDVAAIILGMHRSGTSALTRVLSLYGFTLPGTLLPASETNQKGFWESPNVNALNNEIMETLGQTWFSMDAIPADWARGPAAAAFQGRAIALLKTEYGGLANPILKDPRICRLADFWQDALLAITSRVVAPTIIRNPIEVAHSLTSRNDFDPELGQLLWLRYYLDAEAKTRDIPRAFVNYSALLEDWRSAVSRLGAALSISIETTDDVEAQIDGFLSADLHHHKVTHEAVLATIANVPWLRSAYSILYGWGAGNKPTQAELAELDNIRGEMDAAAPAIAALATNGRVHRKRVSALQDQAGIQRTELHNASSALRKAERKLEKAESNIAQMETRHAATRGQLENLSKEKKLTDQKYIRSQQKYTHAQSKADANRREADRALAEIERMRATRAWRTHLFLARLSKKLSITNLSKKRTKRQREQLSAKIIRESPLFDQAWYLSKYPDVGHGAIDAVMHYLRDGWREGRDPGPQFSTSRYLRANADVAAMDVNPLVHFLEHGQAEGRAVIDHVPSAPAKSTEDFGPAHPVTRHIVRGSNPVRWTRQASLTETADRKSLRLGETMLGYSPAPYDEALAAQIEDIIGLFCHLTGDQHATAFTGREGVATDTAPQLQTSTAPDLIDSWYANDLTLRTRWRANDATPFVIRAYQFAAGSPSPRCVGEGRIADTLDHVDFALASPFSPVLIIGSRLDATVCGAALLPFPSLCRAGLHYGELLALHPADHPRQAVDIIGSSQALVAGLQAVIAGAKTPAISAIEADLRHAKGTEAIFAPDFQHWLRHTMRMDVSAGEPHEDQDPSAADYLTQSLSAPGAGESSKIRKNGAFLLNLPANSVPTIQALTAAASSKTMPMDDPQKAVPGSFIFAEQGPSASKYLVEIPAGTADLMALQPSGPASGFPYLSAARSEGTWQNKAPDDLAVAIRISDGRELSASELLKPVAESGPPLAPAASARKILALLQYPGWADCAPKTAIEALAQQQGSENISLMLADAPDPLPANLADICEHHFPQRWRAVQTIDPSWSAFDADAILYLGQNVIPHDSRTLATLSALIENRAVVSASCVMIRPEEAKKGWKISAESGGFVGWSDFEQAETLKPIKDLRILSRCTYPVAVQSADLWMAKIEHLKTMDMLPEALRGDSVSMPPSLDGGYHLMTSAISASLAGPPKDIDTHLNAQALRHASTVRIKVLHG
ncbi:hypothetical protein KFK14_14915 [Sphingobium phenoxybenzoativorans]|uniref:Sulfotransferase family protein n=1 Tax=Sphingobium phenoxybenzoativorans TaxID=1592790 RepID=A0A975K4Q8_9SPHN|nr:hypothetical protein [Sphingobium phenoxybenzoativorans]QUT04354.1 hypothetical protein KFK14_14915 [Sphingobium phenoxybenzoativorans]